MKIATKVMIGFAIVILLMLLVVFYQILQMRELEALNRNVSQIITRALNFSVGLKPNLRQIQDLTERFFVLADFDYQLRVQEIGDQLESGLERFQALELSPEVAREINAFGGTWAEYERASSGHWDILRKVKSDGLVQRLQAGEFDPFRVRQLAYLELLSEMADRIVLATEQAIQFRVDQAGETGRHAESIARSMIAILIVVSILVVALVVTSIYRPLRRLSRGTEALSEGIFSHRVQVPNDDELGALARSFNQMARRLGELDELKKDFVSYVSHELKAPLASIQETINLLLEGIPGKVNDQQQRLLQINLQCSKRLQSMIGNLLDLSRMEAGYMVYDVCPQDMKVLVTRAAQEYESLFGERGLKLDLNLPEEPVPIECDAQRIIQVIGNLLNNAIKFSPKGETVSLKLDFFSDADHLEGPGVRLTISDRGAGVEDKDKTSIFEKFYQVEGDKKRSGQGTGLGLCISRIIVEGHQGEIWVEDHPGGGAAFKVELPACRA